MSTSITLTETSTIPLTTAITNTTTEFDTCNISHVYGYVAIGVVFLLSLFGTLCPAVIQKLRPKWDVLKHPCFKFCQGMAGGFVIAVALVHAFPEGSNALENEDIGLPDYAWGGLFALLGLLATWTCEAFITLYLKNKKSGHGHGHDHDHDHSSQDLESRDEVELTEVTAAKLAAKEQEKQNDAHCDHALEKVISMEISSKDYSALLILLFGLTFHSVFVGFAVGLNNDRNLFIAVLCHQFFEAMAIGFHILRTRAFKNLWYLALIVGVFSLSAPVGSGIGIGVSATICNDTTTFDLVSGIFETVAAGILIYVGCVHMLAEEFSKPEVLNNWLTAALFWLGVVIGMTLMSIIGIWA